MNNYISKKIYRLFESRKVLNIRFLIQKFFKEKDIGNLNFDFTDKPDRVKIIQEIIELKDYKNYLEIGCFRNELFDQINCENKVGVDPVSGGTIRTTSDEFFKKNDKKFDCIFIDGLHRYHQVKRDILNSLNVLNKGGIILLHDCLPSNVYEQAIPRCQYKWNGDVWKAIVEFRTYKDLDTYTCYADHGIGVIFKKPNKNQLNLDRENFLNLRFKDYFENYKRYMNLISYSKLIELVKEN
tara:strand:- start:84 stop:803 length:720 start_codon:yes stop_codon:yes gene_type:complete